MPERLQGPVPDKLGAPPSGEAFEVETTPVVLDPEVCHARFRILGTQTGYLQASGNAILSCKDRRCGTNINRGTKISTTLYGDERAGEVGEDLRDKARGQILIYMCGVWKLNEATGFSEEIPDEILPENLRRNPAPSVATLIGE